MSVSLSLTSSQSKVFKTVTKNAKIKGLVYFDGNPELNADNFPKVVDAIQAAYFKVIMTEAEEKNTDELQMISDKLERLASFFPEKVEVDLSDPKWTAIEAGTSLEDEVKKVDENNGK